MAKKTKSAPAVDENLLRWEEFAAANSAQYALIDAEGNLIGDRAYEFIREPENGFSVFKKEGKYGFLRIDGTEAIAPIYEGVGDFNEGLAAVKIDGRWGFINEQGEVIISPKYEDKPYFRDDLAAVVINGKHGFIDRSGNEVIAPIYEYAYMFEDGLACVKVDGKYGFIDKSGKMVIEPVFDKVQHDMSACFWRRGYAVVTKANKKGLIDRSGNAILPFEYDDVSFFPDMASSRQSIGDETYYEISVKPGGTGLLDTKGVVIAPIYDKLANYSSGLAAVRKDGKWGYIDIEGNIVLPLEYDSASSFSGNYARVTKEKRTFIIDKTGREICDKIESLDYDRDQPLKGYIAGIMDGKYGLLDDAGHFIMPCEYDDMDQWGIVPLIHIRKDGKYGLYDLTGKEIIKAEYGSIGTPRKEGVPVCITYKWREKEGVIDQTGHFILDPEEFLSCRVEENVPVIVITDHSGKCGIRRYDGSVVTPCTFDSIYFDSNGFARATKDNKKGILNSDGEWVIPAEYDNVNDMSEGYVGAEKDGKWGFLNDKNEWVIAPAYDTIYRNFENGYAIVMNDGKYILINSKGKELTKPSSKLELRDPSDGMIRFVVGRKCGYLNEEGEVAIKPTFDEADDFKNGCALVSIKVEKEPKWTFVTKDGITHELFDDRVYNVGTLIQVKSGDKKGLFRPNGTMAVPYVLKEVPRYIDGPSVIQFI